MPSHSERAFEVGYDTSGTVVDHSELYFSDLPGGSECEALLEITRAGGHAHAARAMRDQAQLAPHMRQWLSWPEAVEAFSYCDARFQLTWRSPAKGAGILFLSREDELSLGALLLAGLGPAESSALPDPDTTEAVFTAMLRTRLSDPAFERAGALKLIRLTRRPLVATVFWPPRADEDSDVRTIQRMLAFQFFTALGVIRSRPSPI